MLVERVMGTAAVVARHVLLHRLPRSALMQDLHARRTATVGAPVVQQRALRCGAPLRMQDRSAMQKVAPAGAVTVSRCARQQGTTARPVRPVEMTARSARVGLVSRRLHRLLRGAFPGGRSTSRFFYPVPHVYLGARTYSYL